MVVGTHVLESLLFLFEPLVGGHQLLLGLVEVVLELLHLFLKFSDLLLSLGSHKHWLVQLDLAKSRPSRCHIKKLSSCHTNTQINDGYLFLGFVIDSCGSKFVKLHLKC